jgi:hypothetical protein
MKRIPLTKGKYALIDDADFECVNQFKWAYSSKNGYCCRSIQGSAFNIKTGKKKNISILMHRFILNAPKGMEVDHKNGNRLDNQRKNIRICTISENRRNCSKRKSKCLSKYKGVTFERRSGRKNKSTVPWKAAIRAPGVKSPKFLGFFATEKEAALAYDSAATLYFGDFSKLNFPRSI